MGLANDTFKKGTKVQLPSGGPEMTVTGIDNDHVHTCWFHLGLDLTTAKFPHGVLKEVK